MSLAISRRALRALAVAGVLAGAAGRGAAQDPDSTRGQDPVPTLPDGTRRVEGRVVIPGDSDMRVVPGAWVTLHRVASDRAGPLDSTRTDASGTFRFTYRPTGSADAIYFVSTTHAGIAYFSRPLRLPVVRGDDAEIAVFDTTSAPVRITVRGRHAVVSAADADGSRTVLEVFELSNDSSVTAVAPPGAGRGTWSTPLPRAARDVQLRQGEVAPDAVSTAGGRLTLVAPFGPGLKQIAFSYRVPASEFPVAFPVDVATSLFEVLVEDPLGTARGPKVVPVAPVTLEGRSFRRFLAQDLPQGVTVDVDVPAAPSADGRRYVVPAVIVAVGALMLGALAFSARRRSGTQPTVAARSGGAPSAVPPVAREVSMPLLVLDGEAARLAREIAALDDEHAAANGAAKDAANGTDEGPHDDGYANRRAELKRQLAAALADGGAPR